MQLLLSCRFCLNIVELRPTTNQWCLWLNYNVHDVQNFAIIHLIIQRVPTKSSLWIIVYITNKVLDLLKKKTPLASKIHEIGFTVGAFLMIWVKTKTLHRWNDEKCKNYPKHHRCQWCIYLSSLVWFTVEEFFGAESMTCNS